MSIYTRLLLVVCLGCGNKSEVPGETDAGDADTDTDADSDTDADTDTDPEGPPVYFAHVVDNTTIAPTHVAFGDLTGDAIPDIVVSHMGEFPAPNVPPSGTVTLYDRVGGIETWSGTVIVDVSAGILFPNQPTLHDVDGDQDPDLILPSGSAYCNIVNQPDCGAINWFENTGAAWTRRQVVAGDSLFYTSVVVEDVDLDGIDDLVTVGESKTALDGSAETRWFRGNGNGFDAVPRPIGAGGGAFPVVYDIDGDGDTDILSAEFNVDGGSFAWFERISDPDGGNPAGVWTRHVMNDSLGPSWMFTLVPDLLGDGVLWGVGTNHSNTTRYTAPDPWESAAYAFEIPADPRNVWPATALSTGIEVNLGAIDLAPGMIGAGDLDGDGDTDLAVAGDGDNRVYLLESRDGGTFETHILWTGVPAAAGMKVVDLDLSGTNEIILVSPTEDAVLVIERL